METGIDYKGLLFVYDDEVLEIKVWQGETYKASYDTFSASEYVVKFMVYRDELYALTNLARLLKLDAINAGVEDTWSELIAAGSNTGCDMVNYDDDIVVVLNDGIYKYVAGETTFQTITTWAGFTVYSALSVNDKLYMYGTNGINMKIYQYDGVFSLLWDDNTHGFDIDYSFYNPYGKTLMVEYNGKLFFWNYYDGTTIKLMCLDTSTEEAVEVTEFNDAISGISGAIVCMMIENDVLLVSVYDDPNNVSQIYVHILDEYKFEKDLPARAMAKDRLYRVETDPVFPSAHDKERVVFYPSYTVLGSLGSSYKPLFKYGKRLEFYTDLNDVSDLQNINLKDTMNELCNLMDCYFFIRPENKAELDLKDLVGRSNRDLILSDDKFYGDYQIISLDFYQQGYNNFRRIKTSWKNILIGDGMEVVGAASVIDVDEYELNSFLVNNPILAKNISDYIFSKMYNSDMLEMTLEFVFELRNNYNVSIFPVSNFLYLNKDKEFKVVKVEHSDSQKTTKVTLMERNLIFNSLEI